MRVILADDAVLFREGAARVLAEAGFEVIGQAGDGCELQRLVQRDPPDVAVIDIRMPPTRTTEGIQAAIAIREQSPDVGLLLLSQHVETHAAMQLLGQFDGGVGYLLKDRISDLAAFAEDVRRVANAGCVIDPELVTRLLDKRRTHDPLAPLTEREREVLALMAEGLTNRALSARLHLSAKTIEAHVRSIFMKLDLAPGASDHRRVLAVLAFLRAS